LTEVVFTVGIDEDLNVGFSATGVRVFILGAAVEGFMEVGAIDFILGAAVTKEAFAVGVEGLTI
jgi:hypothetical protein